MSGSQEVGSIVFYYVLPGLGIYGGIKKAFHCADALTSAGLACAVASPSGGRPDWFPSSSPTLTREELRRRCRPEDVLLFSSPADLEFVEALPATRRVVDMQGASTPADVEMMRHDLDYISHGLHMTYTLTGAGRVAPYVPLGIPDVFRREGHRREGTVAVMPRKGSEALGAIASILRDEEELLPIDGLDEAGVASRLREADLFVAISPDEAFGLPPLEAMAAGCCVVGYPGIGGFEFMRHGETAWTVPNSDLDALLRALRRVLDDRDLKEHLREGGRRVAGFYTMEREREYLLRAFALLGLA